MADKAVLPRVHEPSDASPLVEQVKTWLADGGSARTDWHVDADGSFWCRVTPADRRQRLQGWKLHVSATPVSAPEVLKRVVPVLARSATAFKFASTTDRVRWLTGRDSGRGEYGKFVTVYPADDAQAVWLARELHAATAGLAGPRILSDMPYRPGSLVHYRYGGFEPQAELSNDGVFRYLLVGPNGSRIEDRRDRPFAPPAWAPCPFEQPETRARVGDQAEGDPQSATQAVLLADTYVVQRAVRHSAKGGVYQAVDRATGNKVVVKHARAHAETDRSGFDARDRLRHEAEMLRRLQGQVRVPEVLAIFEQQDDLFLAEEWLAGKSLRQWVHEMSNGNAGVPWEHARPLAERLVELVTAAHNAGVAICDLSPTNILVTTDGSVQLIDLEHAEPIGQPVRTTGTPAYQAPEVGDPTQAVLAGAAGDVFSLGALLFLLATANDPLLAEDHPFARPASTRLADWLRVVSRVGDTARELSPAIVGLMDEAPPQRWSLIRLSRFLTPERNQGRPASIGGPTPSTETLAHDALDYLLNTIDPGGERLWPTGGFGAQTDPGNVQHGAAGVLGALLVAQRCLAGSPTDAGPVAAAARTAADWLAALPVPSPADRVLPGLYFGRAGIAWALADAGVALGEPGFVQRAVELAVRLPLRWPNPDVTHGLAGAGLAQLRLWSLTGEARLLDRAAHCADQLMLAADTGTHAGEGERQRAGGRGPEGPAWPIPSDFDSSLAGTRHYGFAHGTAGVATFLLAAGQATHRACYVDVARQAGDGLCALAQVDEHGAAWWPSGPKDPTRLPHWCSGSSGIGTFLLRLFQVTGEVSYAEYATAAARAVHRGRWQSLPSACHGLAGNGQFLLDLAAALDDDPYRRWAEDLATLLAARHCRRDGRVLVPDESGRTVVADYNVGLAGILAFLLRLRHGGARPWMVDELTSGGMRW